MSDITPVRTTLSRCIVCGEDLGTENPRQYCCKTYCPQLRDIRRNAKRKRMEEEKETEVSAGPFSYSQTKYMIPENASGLIIISKNGEEIGCFDSKYCSVERKTSLKTVKNVMKKELLRLKMKMDSYAFYKMSSSENRNIIEDECELEEINISIRTKFTLENIRYTSLKHTYDYISDLDGTCNVDTDKRCYCFQNSCIRCAYRKYTSVNLKLTDDLDKRQKKFL